MTEEIIIDGELSCNNCLEKTRCKQQQEVKAKRIDAILSYIANEYNEKYITELKNEIPAITRCDVVLEKQLKRLEQENKELKEWKDKVVKLFESACRCKYLNEETDICSYTNEKCININKCAYKYQELSDKYRSALEEILESARFAQCLPCGDIYNCDNCDDEHTQSGKYCMHKRIEEIKDKIKKILSYK